MQALIDLVTSHLLSNHFEQTFFVSHNSALDLALFKYHLHIDNGVVVESNLPAEPAIQDQAQPSVSTFDGTNTHKHSDNESVIEPQVMPL